MSDGRFPIDLVAVIAVTIGVLVATFVPVIDLMGLRVPLGTVFVLFIPGYAFVSALFPERASSRDPDAHQPSSVVPTSMTDSAPSGLERLVLAFALSVAFVVLVTAGLASTPWGAHVGPVATTLGAGTLLATAVAAVRRQQLPPQERFRLPYRRWLRTGRHALFAPDTRAEAVVNVALFIAVLLAVGSVWYVGSVPPGDDSFSTLYVFTEDDEVPTGLEPDEAESLIVGVENHERASTTYTLVVLEQRVNEANDGVTVEDQREVDRFEFELEEGETWTQHSELDPTDEENIRFVWLLYLDDPPEEPSTETAPYGVHVWVDA